MGIFKEYYQFVFWNKSYNKIKLYQKQECIPVGCITSLQWPFWEGGCLPRSVCPEKRLLKSVYGGCPPRGRVSTRRECLPRVFLPRVCMCVYLCLCVLGVSAKGGVHPLWTEFSTHTCENITFPQLLLRMVIINNLSF